ncbi:DUF1727 domain-containing protein [Amycolatopsis sp. NBC_01488]|uniref:DUF1727 domain-containing protein n=1 Tax=Amycolatopsis sp. NBC_01488 TaxID=2903563 RepID=UPI002E2C3487|nr:MurT ligase domain-containing protein [Amycolatopsis sp. NBC_01488]
MTGSFAFRARAALPLRTALAAGLGRLATRGSRAAGLGRGAVIGGRVILALQPTALADLCRDKVVVLVTGTNGKTTTTCMLARAMNVLAAVACNDTGANMPDGLAAALAADPNAPCAVLEVDENHLPAVLADVTPAMVVLLNLSRDQLDRTGEVRRTERVLRAALAQCSSTVVLANCDDVLVTSAAWGAAIPLWISPGTTWRRDGASCPRCGSAIRETVGHWSCFCGFARPEPRWTVDRGGDLMHAGGLRVPLATSLPGEVNRHNLAFATAAAASLGVPAAAAAAAAGSVREVDGRYRLASYGNHTVRILLAKNPAGWAETLHILGSNAAPAVLAVNARQADGADLSWLWDVNFESLRGRRVVVSGERLMDLSVRLSYGEVAHWIEPDPLEAITRLPPGPVDLVANYTAFRDVTARLPHDQ